MAKVYAGIEDLRRAAQRRTPRMVFDYVDGAARAEITMRNNRAAFDDVGFQPKMAVESNEVDLSTTVLGRQLALPLILSPCGGLRAVHPDGDAGAARAAHRAGTVFTLSSAAGMTIEDVAAAAPGPRWFQLYFLGGRAGAERLVERAARAGYEALLVTVDTNVPGVRERDVRNGLTRGLDITASNIVRFAPQVALRPGWLVRYMRDGMSVRVANAAGLGLDGNIMSPEQASALMFAEPPTWTDISWLRDHWKGPLLVKGVLSADDARYAVDLGADGVVVSNHGGRQLDGAPATLRVLPSVVDAIGHQATVLIDSGVRRGSDIVKAVAMGAKAAMIGRAYAYGLGAHGEAGVDTAIGLLRNELRNTMQLLGCASVVQLDRSWLDLAH